jgi:SAM-dependent methyltransferase
VLRPTNAVLRAVTAKGHALQHFAEWEVPPPPEWYDHYLDLHWGWPKRGRGLFVERGVYGSLAIESDATVLELCCGDGFNARHFYAPRANRVIAVDFDPAAIGHAQRRNRHPKVQYLCADIRKEMPGGRFTNVIFDAAIEHFTEPEIDRLLADISERLGEEGVLAGYTLVARGTDKKHLEHHEREFTGKADLLQVLERAFPHVTIFETVHSERTNLYFYAAHDASRIPFDPSNRAFLRSQTA